MPAAVAEAYMLALRETKVPVFGESFAPPFVAMIQLDGLEWGLKPTRVARIRVSRPQQAGDAAEEEDDSGPAAEAPPFNGRRLIEQVMRAMRRSGSQQQREADVRRVIQRATQQHDREREAVDRENSSEGGGQEPEDRAEDEKLSMKFTKNADLSTSQLLSLMVNGRPLPSVNVTLFHRSLHAPMTLLVQFKDVRLRNYTIECDAEEAMSDVKETWTAEYEAVKFTYQNRPPLGLPYSIASGVAIATSQGRIKEFEMQDSGPWLL